MSRLRRKTNREKNQTDQILRDLDQPSADDDGQHTHQRFGDKTKHSQQSRIERTTAERAAARAADPDAADLERLPIGQVTQVFSVWSEVLADGGPRMCTMRKTLSRSSASAMVVGDRVRFRDDDKRDESGRAHAVIEQVLPRKTVLARAGSFHSHEVQPIVANAEQMLIVVSVVNPIAKWGLVDRMLIAAQSGGLKPIVCLNKIDLAERDAKAAAQYARAKEVLAHYRTMEIESLEVAAVEGVGLQRIKEILHDHTTVLAGHSGVGKSTLIGALQAGLDIRIGKVSEVTEKGRHTTTSARRYPLDDGGEVIDTPGVKMFGLWEVTAETLNQYFPDVEEGTAPAWRVESHQRILESLK